MTGDTSGSKRIDLATYIAEHINRPFEWGSHDCCTFVGGWIQIKTGRDYLIRHRPWRSAREARKKLRDLNGLSFFLDQHFASIHPYMAKDGDLTIINGAAALFSGRHIVAVGLKGLEYADRTRVECAWRC